MRLAVLGLSLSFVCACAAFDPDDGTRALSVTTVSSWTGAALGAVTVRACLDDGQVHAADWGEGCAVSTGSSDFQGGLRLEGLEPELYQIYLDGPDPWGSHAQLVSLVDGNGAISVDVDPASAAAIQVVGDYDLGLPQVRLVVGPADNCGPNELVLDLPTFASGKLMGTNTAGCMEIENNDFVGVATFEETSRTPALDECGGSWCEDWGTIAQPRRRRGALNGVLDYADQQVQIDGEWLE